MPIDKIRTMLEAREEKKEVALIEDLAALEHDQWIEGTKRLEAKEVLSLECVRRWKTRWIPYALLTETHKELYRKQAQKILDVIHQNGNNQK